MQASTIDPPIMIFGRLAMLILIGGMLPQLFGLLARGLKHKAILARSILGAVLPAVTFFAIALMFFRTQAAAHFATAGRPPCGAFGAVMLIVLTFGPVIHGAIAVVFHRLLFGKFDLLTGR